MSGNDITLSSTTDSAQQIEQALDHDEQTAYSESAPTAGHVHIASTTDSQTQVNEAAFLHDTAAEEGAAPYVTPVIMSADRSVSSTTDDQASVDEAAQDLAQERADPDRPDYLGKSKRWRERGLVEQVKRQAAQIDELREQLAGSTPPPETESSEQPQDDQGQQNDQARQQQLRQQAEWELRKIQGEASLPYRYELFKQSHPDVDQVLAQGPVMPAPIQHALRTEADGLSVAYYLGKHPDVAQNIAAAWQAGNQQQAASALDQISNGLRFQSQNQPAQQRPQNHNREPANPPSRPLRHVSSSGTAGTSRGLDDPNLPFSEYQKIRNEMDHQRGGR